MQLKPRRKYSCCLLAAGGLFASMFTLVVLLCGLGALGVRQSKQEIARADELWLEGNVAEAVRIYVRELNFVDAADKPEVFKRIITHRHDSGDVEGAKEFCERAIAEQINVRFTRDELERLMAGVEQAIADREAEELAVQRANEAEELAAQRAKEAEELAAQRAKEAEELAAQRAKEAEELAARQAKEAEELAARQAQVPDPGEMPTVPAGSATVIRSRLVSFKSPARPERMQQVRTTWKNTGSTPIRAVDCTFTFLDKRRQTIGSYDYTLYAVFDTDPGVAPGEIYTTPSGEGFLFPDWEHAGVKAADVEVQITKVLQHSAFEPTAP